MSTPLPNTTEAGNSESANQTVRARRDFLRGVTVAAGGGVAAALLSGQTTTPGTTTPSPANDITLLNYALTLELLEATFYTQGLSRFTSTDFSQSTALGNLRSSSGVATAPLAGDTDTSLAQDVYAYLTLIRNHEQQHVRTLRNIIRSLGGTPVNPPTFKLNFTNADDFLSTAMLLENTGVAAYNGAIAMLSNPSLVTASATIATVEGRHAAYLNRIEGQNPFPNAFDAGKTMAEILAAALPFLG